MKLSLRLSAVVLLGVSMLGLGCEGADARDPLQAIEAGAEVKVEPALAEVKQGAVGDTLMRCTQPQDGSYLEVVQTATGYEAATVVEAYDPWDCRCTYEKRTVLGQYTQCRRSTVDPRIMNCYRVEPTGSIGKVVLSTTRVQRTQMVIGGTQTVSYTDLSIAAINQDPGHTPRQDFTYSLSDCQ
ncbi:hypothetical protein D7X55_28695 [Corallococcus sp. AB049A]|uniref:Lipoprotein n=1 Tax=Corallococcus interemptor TaxID=2316720 RepID=A0A3A8QMB4_9BACT|nr:MULTISPECIES: hypothetical protein [Corallococcus]RKH46180.1 hypothetical protein D7Y23_24395 [Corallococcus sp. AB050B]RKH69657.1 hypothetical protein D7X96_14460 [Corallococcus interemptor]RKI56284.1 hypothetical protein D7X55_28695 [Corallococcus sp. AB049A]